MNLRNTNPSPYLFAIISPARCRSSYLRGLLHSHPLAMCHGEIFHQTETMIRGMPASNRLLDMEWRNNHPDLYIQQMIKESKQHNPHHVLTGCKILLYSSQLKLGFNAILNCHPLVILLNRANKLAWYSSYKISNETNVWTTGKKLPEQHKVKFELEEFQRMIGALEKSFSRCRDRLIADNIQFMEVESKDLPQQITQEKILRFLGLPDFGLSTSLVSQNSSDILSRFTNQDEVCDYLHAHNKPAWSTE